MAHATHPLVESAAQTRLQAQNILLDNWGLALTVLC